MAPMFVRNILPLSSGLKLIELSYHMAYDQVARKVANQIKGWE
jgi:hypothetical protein